MYCKNTKVLSLFDLQEAQNLIRTNDDFSINEDSSKFKQRTRNVSYRRKKSEIFEKRKKNQQQQRQQQQKRLFLQLELSNVRQRSEKLQMNSYFFQKQTSFSEFRRRRKKILPCAEKKSFLVLKMAKVWP